MWTSVFLAISSIAHPSSSVVFVTTITSSHHLTRRPRQYCTLLSLLRQIQHRHLPLGKNQSTLSIHLSSLLFMIDVVDCSS
ncbi:unnamed protein product [Macrosiphum euphorbiae]|uniref:Secreted protein n=1 Tax=Macrosiphum euphorbiae TaxID=13131 RepID=A0AAV0X3U8_9HEMI|nr:unnamed protein product [Macrosiphum euphorbiae]